jgi:uncharacterized protein (TIGR00369 family)
MDLTAPQVDEFVRIQYPAVSEDGFSCEAIEEGLAVARWRHDPAHLRPGGLISGPTQFTAADLALWFLSFTVVGLRPMAVTSDIHITFLRPAVGGDLLARAELLRAGRTRISGQVRLWVDGDPDRPVSNVVGAYGVLA